MPLPPFLPRFSANIRFVSKTRLDTLVKAQHLKKREIAAGLWTPEDKVSLQKRAYTEGIGDCNMLGITLPGKKASVFHLTTMEYPTPRQPQAKNSLPGCLEAVKAEFRKFLALPGKVEAAKPRALFLGGNAMDMPSRVHGAALYKAVQESGLPHSVIWGDMSRFGGATSAYYSAQDDTWWVNTRFLGAETTEDVKNVAELKYHFAIIQLAPEDHLFIEDREIPHAAVNQWETRAIAKPAPAQSGF